MTKKTTNPKVDQGILTPELINELNEKSTESGHDLLYQAIVSVYGDSPFWGTILANVKKRAWTDAEISAMEAQGSPSTIGVSFDTHSCRFQMFYNPKFLVTLFELMEEKEFKVTAAKVVMHEMAHIIWGHATTRSYRDKYPHAWANTCMDVVVNHSVGLAADVKTKDGKLIFRGCTAESMTKITGEAWEEGENTEFYLAKLKDMQEKKGSGGEGDGEPMPGGGSGETMDSHESFGKMDESGAAKGDKAVKGLTDKATGEDLANHEIRRIVERAVKEMRRSGTSWGNMPGGLVERIDAIVGHKINWKKVLTKLVFEAYERSKEKENTRLRPNKRYGLVHPGTRSRRQGTPPCLAGFDCSGSVDSDEEGLAGYVSEVNSAIKKLDATIDIACFDVTVNKVSKRVKKVSTFDVVGRGGTDYNEIVKLYNDNRNYKALFIFTDGHCPLPTDFGSKPVFWFVWGKNRNREFQVNVPLNKVYQID